MNPERLRIEFMSGGEGILFAEVISDFSKQVEALGPLGQGEGLDPDKVKATIQEVAKLVPYIKIVKRQKLESRPETKEEYDALFTRDEIDRLFREVTSYYIDPEVCQACMICFKKCPVEAIDGGKNRIHVIDQDQCIKCGTCFDACPPRFGAVKTVSGEPVPVSIPEAERTIARKSKKQ